VKDIILPRIRRDKVYTFLLTVQTAVNGATGIETDGSIAYTLNGLSNGNTLAAVFDSYRIMGITARFVPNSVEANGPNGSSPIGVAIDYDDTSSVNLANLQAYDTVSYAPAGTLFERSFQPRVTNALYSGVFTSFGQQKLQWIDSVSAGVVHYGLKYAIPASPAPPSWFVFSECIVQFRNVR